jgi:hypothetical protein
MSGQGINYGSCITLRIESDHDESITNWLQWFRDRQNQKQQRVCIIVTQNKSKMGLIMDSVC